MHDRSGWRWRVGTALLVVASLAAIAGRLGLGGVPISGYREHPCRVPGAIKVGTWTPVWIQLRGGIDGFSGFLEVISQDEDGTPTTIRQPVQVGPGGSQRVTAYVRPGSQDTDFAHPPVHRREDARRAIPDVKIGDMFGNRPPEPCTRTTISSSRSAPVGGREHLVIAGLQRRARMPRPSPTVGPGKWSSPGSRRSTTFSRAAGTASTRWMSSSSTPTTRKCWRPSSGNRGEALKQWVQRGGHLRGRRLFRAGKR